VFPTDSLQTVITKLSLNKTHRIYIVANEESMEVMGVVTLKDVIREILF
jgi:CBS domain-containing protein